MHSAYGLRRENGAALVISLLILAVLLVVGSGSLTTSRIETQITVNDEKVKQALLVAEYAMALGETTLEHTSTESDVSLGQFPGRFSIGQQPAWDNCRWDDRDSIDVTTYFDPPTSANPGNLPHLPLPLQDAHERPRLMIEGKLRHRPSSLSIGIKPAQVVWYFNVSAHGGRARWPALDNCQLETNAAQVCQQNRLGETDTTITYHDRYPGTRVVIQSVYVKRYN